jgi:hypothetical protein
MRLLPLALLVVGVAAQDASDEPVNRRSIMIAGLTASGTGCPPGSTNVKFDPSSDMFDLKFRNFTAEVGPDAPPNGVVRKSCHIRIDLVVPKGFTYGRSL